MSLRATVFQVMIASPSDVPDERTVIPEILAEWNAIYAARRKIVLLPRMWETHASPEMGDRPQSIINRQVADECDLLVGVFWTRLGTPTGEYSSGTVEEIERFIGGGKLVMLYFNEAPVREDSIFDPEQYEELQKFKGACRDRGLYTTYDDLTDFRIKFYRQLQLKLEKHPLFTSIDGGDDTPVEVTSPRGDGPPALSNDAEELLRLAATDRNGTLLHLKTFGGDVIQAGSHTVTEGADHRSTARWLAALAELEDSGLVVALGPKREVFELTNDGYNAVEAAPTRESDATHATTDEKSGDEIPAEELTILELLARDASSFPTDFIASQMKMGIHRAKFHLQNLAKAGLARMVRGRSTMPAGYTLTDDGRALLFELGLLK